MARQTDKGINGVVGPVILYTVNGRQYMRSKPGPRSRKKKPAPVTEANNKVFGLVSACGSDMVRAVRDRFRYPFRLATHNTIRGWMRNQYAFYHQSPEWKLAIRGSDICQLNPEASLAEHLRAGLSISDAGKGKIALTIDALDPKRDLKAPQGTDSVQIKVVAAVSAFDRDHCQTVSAEEVYLIPYPGQALPAKTLLLDTGGKAGDTATVWVGLTYYKNAYLPEHYSRELRHLPLAIIAMGRLGGSDLQ
ncbi:MAG TPA: hypothetical protein VG842_04010 [Sediminibacterium sp.]|nr:hypothetical protein [Sediminibacterium sp.]